MAAPRIRPFGEAALLVELDDVASIANARRSRALAASIERLRGEVDWLGVPLPAAASVLVPFEAASADAQEAAALIAATIGAEATFEPERTVPRTHRLRVRYGGDDGPDLENVASELGLRPADVVELHAAAAYEVLFLGFAPGFAYLGDVDVGLLVPRLATPRIRVPAGSVAIAGTMTAVYPHASPGGWRILGRTGARLFDPARVPPSLLRPGDHVHFVPSP